MGKVELVIFKTVKNQYGGNVLKEALKMTTDDIKANNILLGKKTSSLDFMVVFYRSLSLCIA